MNVPHDTDDHPPDPQRPAIVDPKAGRLGDYWVARILSWLGIIGAGGLYGIIIGGGEPIFSFIAGIIVAAVVSVPVIGSIAVLAWALWLSRFELALTAFAGACTGIASSALIAPQVYPDAAIPLIIVAGCLGGGGSSLAALIYWSDRTKPLEYGRDDSSRVWQYSLRELFLRFTALTILIAVWAALLVKMIGQKT